MSNPRKPTKLKIVEGTFRADRAPKNEPLPKIDDDCPDPPMCLSELAKKEWKRVAPQIHVIGLLTRADYSALELYCELYAEWRKAKTGRDLQNAKAFAQACHRFLTEFGMTPASRSRINVLVDAPISSGKKNNQKEYA